MTQTTVRWLLGPALFLLYTPLFCSMKSSLSLSSVLHNERQERRADETIALSLIQHPALIRLQNQHGDTLLHLASHSLYYGPVLIILEHGGIRSINTMNYEGATPLAATLLHHSWHTIHHESLSKREQVQRQSALYLIIEILLRRGADPRVYREALYSPLTLAAIQGFEAVVRRLLRWKTDAGEKLSEEEVHHALHNLDTLESLTPQQEAAKNHLEEALRRGGEQEPCSIPLPTTGKRKDPPL